MKKIIIKYLTNSIDNIELNKLKDWLKKPKNQEIFKNFITDDFNLNNTYTSVNVDEALNNVWKEINKKPKVIPFYKKNIFKYAAAASVVLLLAVSFFLNNKNQYNNTPIIVNNNIETGTDKAILTLGDGTNITLAKGQNYITSNISSNGEEIVYNKPNQKSTETAYNYLTIPRGGQYYLKLDDGTQVWLNSESKLKYPVSFANTEKRQVELVYGEAYFDVSPSHKNNGTKFSVTTNNQEIEVLGTEFNIKAYNNENEIYSTLIEGKINLKLGASIVAVKPNQQTVLNKTTNNITLNNVTDIYSVVSWKSGVFSFKDMPLNKIMKVLTRWYDSDVVFVNKDVENIEFTGILDKNQTIEEILNTIYNTNNVPYEINNKTIIFR
ncbi:FecR family protein [Seonamhaeicola algicola]|uniref:FecR family protein n=1 Tax=Seonamhaeicola algicola TaxID=1719036 RepID=A0A5C7AMY1_9FLAO|nr:FecR domain-containing protein [Seonamhaeicola algicola]TXE09681.1 FecR family protein [Seonamhaeicola algicola]